jgi:hypothetical protein
MCPMARGKIVPVMPDACFVSDLEAALDRIRNSDPVLREMIDALERSETPYLIFKNNLKEATDSWDMADGEQHVDWNPRFDIQLPGEHMCVDPTADLAHELWHKYQIDKNMRAGLPRPWLDRTADGSTNGIPRSEIAAVIAENRYRAAASPSLCLRWKYGNNQLPAAVLPATHCPVLTPDSYCPVPVWPGTCPIYCCLVYNYDGKGNVCWKDNLTVKECSGSLIIKDLRNAGETPHPCSVGNRKFYKPCPF